MSWSETHRRWQILRDVEANHGDGAAELPWTEEYDDLFGDADSLLAMLRHRLDARFGGVRRLLAARQPVGGAHVAA